MKHLTAIYNIGLQPGLSPEDAKYIGMCNLGAFFFILFNIPFLLFFLFWGWTFIVLGYLVFEVCLAMTFIFNRLHATTIGLIWFGSVLNVHLVFMSVVLGWDIIVHYLIFFTAGGAVMLFRRDQHGAMVLSVLGCIATYALAYYLAHRIDPLFPLQDNERHFLNTVIEITFCVLIIVNGLIGRYGALIAEDRLKDEKVRSEALYRQLQKLDRQKTNFFQNISHELRTPLTLITGPLEQALAHQFGPVSQKLERQLKAVLQNAGHLLKQINQLLDLSKLDAGKMILRAKEGNLLGFVTAAVEKFRPIADTSGIRVEINPDSDRTRLNFDHGMIEKVISNLMTNALKFTPHGGQVTLRVSDSPDNAWGTLSVRDTGPGIAPDEVDLIFDRFHQVDGNYAGNLHGTGIGLSLAKELVELHGGRLDVVSEPEAGSEFIVSLPKEASFKKAFDFPVDGAKLGEDHSIFTPALYPPTPPSDTGGVAEKPVDGKPIVLVVEDSEEMRIYIKEMIEGTYTVLEAGNGLAALSMAKQHMPALIISDIMMPEMDGYQLCRAVNQSGELNHIPVILLTAGATDEMALEGMISGAYDYITKPFSRAILLAKIEGIVKRHVEQQALNRTDHLTGLRNRQGWKQEVHREMEKLKRFGGTAAIAFLDLDNFKVVNDTHGHAVGDDVLRAVSTVINNGLRTTDLAGRYGGEEFVIYFPEATGIDVVDTMQRILTRFRNQPVGEKQLNCAFSAGVVSIDPEPHHPLDVYISRADSAMYEAKRRGKGRVVIWNEEIK